MDVRFVNPFIEGIKNVFKTMLETEILISKPCVKMPGDRRADVSAIIGFSGEVSGSVALCFPLRTAVRTASKFAGTEIQKDHPDFADALGELASMVAGQAKSKLEGLNISISLPRVITGNDLYLLESSQTPVLLLPCDSELGRFTTEVTMEVGKRNNNSDAVRATAAAPA